jgi:hypothetical protein
MMRFLALLVALSASFGLRDKTNADWDDAAVFKSLHPAVQQKIVALRTKMAGLGRRIYLMSGARKGQPSASMHNQALAVDVTVDNMDSEGVSVELRAVGFTCVTTYYNSKRKPCFMAHADLRGTNFAKGAYARGGEKASDCPPVATSKTDSCDNDKKAQWIYWRHRTW